MVHCITSRCANAVFLKYVYEYGCETITMGKQGLETYHTVTKIRCYCVQSTDDACIISIFIISFN